MAFPSLATFGSKYPPYFDSLMKANVLKQPLFSFFFAETVSGDWMVVMLEGS